MPWLIGIGVAALIAFAFSQKKEADQSAQARGWSVLLRGPAALPQAAIPELLQNLGIHNIKSAFLASPQTGYNVLTVVTDDTMPAVGTNVQAMGVPLTVMSVQPAPMG